MLKTKLKDLKKSRHLLQLKDGCMNVKKNITNGEWKQTRLVTTFTKVWQNTVMSYWKGNQQLILGVLSGTWIASILISITKLLQGTGYLGTAINLGLAIAGLATTVYLLALVQVAHRVTDKK